jgi:chromosome segregation ATPase
MNLKEQYHAAAMLRIAESDGRRIAELEAERDNAWTELREIRAAISANPEESTLDEVVKLRQQLTAKDEEIRELVTSDNKVIVDLSRYVETLEQQIADRDEQISDLTISSDTYFAERNSARDVWRRASKDRDELRQQLTAALAACKLKDAAIKDLLEFATYSTCGKAHAVEAAKEALTIQPDDSTLKAWVSKRIASTFRKKK